MLLAASNYRIQHPRRPLPSSIPFAGQAVTEGDRICKHPAVALAALNSTGNVALR